MSGRPTPLRAVGRGLVAGAVGTGLMTAYQVAVAKARDSESSTMPAEVAKRIIRGVFQREVSDEQTETLNNAMHIAYGTGWGALYGLAQGTLDAGVMRHGTTFGAIVWGASLIELPAMKLAPPVWEYPPVEAGLDLSYHLVYGLGVAGAYAVLDR
jgi:hypothetical protein